MSEALVASSQEFYGYVLSLVDIALFDMKKQRKNSSRIFIHERSKYRQPGGFAFGFDEFLFGLRPPPLATGAEFFSSNNENDWLSKRDRTPWTSMNLLLPFDKLRRDLARSKGVYLMIENSTPHQTVCVLHTRKSLNFKKTYVITTRTGRTAVCLNPAPARHSFDIIPW